MIEYFVVAASTYAHEIDGLFDLIFWIVAFWFLLTLGAFFWLIFRFRRRPGVASQHVSGDRPEEKRWITWPHLAILAFDIWIIAVAVQVWHRVKQELPPPQATVRVIAQQWAWTFVHPGPDGELDTADDVRTVNKLHLQTGTLYHYKLESVDVLHDFSIPAFRLKQDAIPGRVITGWFEPTRAGSYDIQCAEICGIGHGVMQAQAIVETPDEHAAWLRSQVVGQTAPEERAVSQGLQSGGGERSLGAPRAAAAPGVADGVAARGA